jgi:hypothetical protein
MLSHIFDGVAAIIYLILKETVDNLVALAVRQATALCCAS